MKTPALLLEAKSRLRARPVIEILLRLTDEISGWDCDLITRDKAMTELVKLFKSLNEKPKNPAGIDLTLSETLKALGYTHRPAPHLGQYSHEIMKDGSVAFVGDSFATWAFVRSLTPEGVPS